MQQHTSVVRSKMFCTFYIFSLIKHSLYAIYLTTQQHSLTVEKSHTVQIHENVTVTHSSTLRSDRIATVHRNVNLQLFFLFSEEFLLV